MAFTEKEEANLKKVAAAMDGGGATIASLPEADATDENLTAEVVDSSGASKKVKLFNIVKQLSVRYCGRYWNETLSTPLAAGHLGNIDMLRELPTLLGLGCHTLTDAGASRKLDPTNHYKYQGGSPASLDGSHGQYMWNVNGVYVATRKVGNNTEIAFSDEEFKDRPCIYVPRHFHSAIGPSVLDRTNLLLCSVINDDPQYRGGTNLATWDGTPKSLCGKPVTNVGIHLLSDYARKRGQGWESSWYIAEAMKQLLQYVIMGTRNLQAAVNPEKDANGLYQGGLGVGLTSTSTDGMTAAEWLAWSESTSTYQPHVHTSAGIELGDGVGEVPYQVLNADGSVYKTVKVPVFFGLKNPWGYLWRGCRGLIVDANAEKSTVYVSPSLYNGQSNSSIEGMLEAAQVPRSNGYIKRIDYERLSMAPTEIGGSASTYYADYFWENTAANSFGLRSRLAGGASTHDARSGPAAYYTAYTVTAAGSTTSGSLCFFTEDPVMV